MSFTTPVRMSTLSPVFRRRGLTTRTLVSLCQVLALSLFLAAPAVAAPFAYIPNYYSGSVSVIDTATNTIVATIEVGEFPISAAVNPAGTRVYVPLRWTSYVSVIDTSTNTVVATIDVTPGGQGHAGVAVHPAGTRVYVVDFLYGFSTVSVIDTSTNAVVKKINVGSCPHGVAINPAGTRVYVANWFSQSVTVIDTSTDTVVATISDVGGGPNGVVVNPEGTRVYVSDWYGSVSVIDATTNTVVATVYSGNAPTGVAINPEGTRVYVANRFSQTLSVIDTSTNSVVATVGSLGSEPVGVAVNPAGTRIYVTDFGSPTVFVIDTSTNAVVESVGVGSGSYAAYGIFIGPDLTPAEAASAQIKILIASVESLNLPAGIATSLTAKLRSAQAAIARDDFAAACGQLGAFVNQARAQSGKALTEEQADQLREAANRVRAVLGC